MSTSTVAVVPRHALVVTTVLALTAALVGVLSTPAHASHTSDRVRFVDDPANVVVGDAIANAAGDPIAVEVDAPRLLAFILDIQARLGGNAIGIDVTVGLEVPNGLDGALGGTRTRPVGSAGTAVFDGLTVDAATNGVLGRGYQLTAEAKVTVSPSLPTLVRLALAALGYSNGTPVGSTAFTGTFAVWGAGETCETPGAACQTTLGRVRLALDNQAGGQYLALTQDDLLPADACGSGHQRISDTAVLFDTVVDATGTATIVVEFERARGGPSAGIGQYQVCYVGDKGFTTRSGGAAPASGDPDLPYGPALLPDCNQVGGAAPCVVSTRALGGSSTIPLGQMTIRVPTGDPMFR